MIMAEGGGTMIDFKQFYTDDEVIRLTQDLVRIPSHKYIEDRESRVAEYIYDYCADAGFGYHGDSGRQKKKCDRCPKRDRWRQRPDTKWAYRYGTAI